MDKTLVIWLNNGATTLFHQVEEFKFSSIEITFKYFGNATETKRSARFNTNNIAGFALQD